MFLQSEKLGNIKTFDFLPTNVKSKVTTYGAYEGYAYKLLSLGDFIDLFQLVNDYPEIRDASVSNPFEIVYGVYIIQYVETETAVNYKLRLNRNYYSQATSAPYDIEHEDYFEDEITVYSYKNAPFPLDKFYIYFCSFIGLQITDTIVFNETPLIRIGIYSSNEVQRPQDYTRVMCFVNANVYPYDDPDGHRNGLTIPNVVSSDDPETWYAITKYTASTDATLNGAMNSWIGMRAEDNQNGDNSGEGGGGGNYGDETSDEIPSDGVPTISAISSGFVKIYHPSISNLLDFRDFLYSSGFIDSVKKLIDNPMDYIISLMLNASIPTDGASEYIGAGGVSSSVSAPKLLSQYKLFDCGSVNIEECYGGFLDYDNFTKVTMYLPFCGEIVLDTNIVMHSTIHLQYAVDYLTGDCLARVHVTNNHGAKAETYFKEGNCSCQIPMSGANYASFYTQGLRALMGAGSALGGNVAGVAQSADAVASMHVERSRVGSVGSGHGMLGQYTPYLIIERPAQSFPTNNNMLIGRPSNIGGVVGSFSGYTEIEDVKLDGIQATDAELEEIKQLLADGVYV